MIDKNISDRIQVLISHVSIERCSAKNACQRSGMMFHNPLSPTP